MDDFGSVLWAHLTDEVVELGAENMSKYWSKSRALKALRVVLTQPQPYKRCERCLYSSHKISLHYSSRHMHTDTSV